MTTPQSGVPIFEEIQAELLDAAHGIPEADTVDERIDRLQYRALVTVRRYIQIR
jgi:hypothetical protein